MRRTSPSTPPLRSPTGYDPEAGTLTVVCKVVGAGTAELAEMLPGQSCNVMGPLGKGYPTPCSDETPILVAGGYGSAAILPLAKRSPNKGMLLLGARSAKDVLERELFEQVGRVLITTEDGSEGEKGFVTNHSVLAQEHFDRISTCGPKPMMMAVARYAFKNDIECEVSLENKMACGVGACLCCVEKTVEGNKCVCKEGPVMNIKKLTWQI